MVRLTVAMRSGKRYFVGNRYFFFLALFLFLAVFLLPFFLVCAAPPPLKDEM
jgi:hypothetical protein